MCPPTSRFCLWCVYCVSILAHGMGATRGCGWGLVQSDGVGWGVTVWLRGTGAAASQCVTPRGVRQFGGLWGGGGTPTPLRRGGGDPSPPPWLTQTQHLFRQAPSKRANTQS